MGQGTKPEGFGESGSGRMRRGFGDVPHECNGKGQGGKRVGNGWGMSHWGVTGVTGIAIGASLGTTGETGITGIAMGASLGSTEIYWGTLGFTGVHWRAIALRGWSGPTIPSTHLALPGCGFPLWREGDTSAGCAQP